jgi:hypothetical protein
MAFSKTWALAALGVFMPSAAFAADPIPPVQFKALHTLIKPGPGEEKWTRIPWLTSLWEARKRAAAEGKPILLWEMDGHPLGCV